LALNDIQEERLGKRWSLTQYPTEAYAQEAEMSLREYEDFVYGAILRDWDEERARMKELAEFLNKRREVQIIGEGTDLKMSITGRNAVVGDVTHMFQVAKSSQRLLVIPLKEISLIFRQFDTEKRLMESGSNLPEIG
jgi:hypothetical protein